MDGELRVSDEDHGPERAQALVAIGRRSPVAGRRSPRILRRPRSGKRALRPVSGAVFGEDELGCRLPGFAMSIWGPIFKGKGGKCLVVGIRVTAWCHLVAGAAL